MEAKTVIKLKEDYVFFQDGVFVCLYEKHTKMVVLKMEVGEGAYTEDVKSDLSRPHTLQWLAGQRYWRWLGLIIMRYHCYFDILNEGQLAKDIVETNYFSVVKRKHFAENYLVTSDFDGTRIFLWGATAINLLLLESILKQTAEVYLICDTSETETDSFMSSQQERDMIESLGKDRCIVEQQLETLGIRENDLFFVDATGVAEEELLRINDFLVASGCVTLFYGNKNREVIIGPLVVSGESACMRCLQLQRLMNGYYSGENSFLDEVHVHLFQFFLMRILYYIKGKNLYYLLSDVQIPINKVFTIQKDDITASVKYILRSNGCNCSKRTLDQSINQEGQKGY